MLAHKHDWHAPAVQKSIASTGSSWSVRCCGRSRRRRQYMQKGDLRAGANTPVLDHGVTWGPGRASRRVLYTGSI